MHSVIPNQIIINSHPLAETLIHWYSGAKRDLPWRQTNDPYIVWVSEIILQQTRVDQGLPYFLRFVDAFPRIEDLAIAPEDAVLANWQGLGYYSRARNMHATAKLIQTEYGGKFPSTYNEIIKLKGIGPYTAAAIASICFNEPKPVVDGNVFRVVSRLFGIKDDIAKSGTRKVFENVLDELIPIDDPGTFNQAMMEYGATICTPSANCEICVVRESCYAFANKMTKDLPVKSKILKVKDRHLNYLVMDDGESVLMRKRGPKDIWEGLYDFLLTEDGETLEFSEPIVHLLSHQRLHVRFARRSVETKKLEEMARSQGGNLFSFKQILNLPKPKVITDYILKTFGEELPNT